MRLLRLYESKYGQEHRQTLRTQSLLAKNLSIQERYSEAETLLRNVLPPMKELGEDDDITLATLNALSVVLSHQSKFAEAEVILNVLVTNCTRKHGKEHLDTLLNRTNLATCLFRQGNLARAEEILREVLELQQRIVRKNHPHSIDARNWLEYVIQAQAQAQAQVLSTNGLPTNLRNPSIPTNPELLSDGRPLKPQRKSVRLERIRQAASRASPKPSRRSKKSRNNRKSVYRKLPRFRTPDLYSHQMIVYRLIKVWMCSYAL